MISPLGAVSSLADACPSLAHHPGDLPAVVPHDVSVDAGGVLRAEYRCPVCGRVWPAWWELPAPWPAPLPPSRPGGARGGRVEDFAELRAEGLTVAGAAARLGVTPRTATRYAAALREAEAA